MRGYIKNFTRGRKTSNNNAVVVRLAEVKDKDSAQNLVGKEVKILGGRGSIGKVVAPHGDKGAVKAVFRKALPGQAISAKVSIT